MARLELIQELQLREKELMEELEAIRKILSSNSLLAGKSEMQDSMSPLTASKYTPKDEMTWPDYVEILLKEIGGKGKAADVYKAASEANPNIDVKTINSAVKSKLSLLYREGKIGANEGKIRSQGHEYFILNEKHQRNNNEIAETDNHGATNAHS